MSAAGDAASVVRRRRIGAALIGSAVLAVTVVVMAAAGIASGPTASTARQSQAPRPVVPASVSPGSTVQADPSGGAVPGPGRPSLDRPVPEAALVALRAAVHDLTVADPGYVRPESARLEHYQVDSWRSPDHFTLLVTFDLHFATKNTMAWNEGLNTRFVRFTTTHAGSAYQLGWATSP